MLINGYEKNIRHFLSIIPKEEPKHNIIALPPPKHYEDWESDDESTSSTKYKLESGVVQEPNKSLQVDDQNDWGGLTSAMDRDQEYAEYTLRTKQQKIYWVIPAFLAIGGHPFDFSLEKDLSYLQKEKVQTIVSAYEKPLEHKYTKDFYRYYFAPTIKNYTADLIGICEFMEKMEEEKKSIFIHSFTGMSRAPTILAAYFTYKQLIPNIRESIKQVLELVPGSSITDHQQIELLKFVSRL